MNALEIVAASAKPGAHPSILSRGELEDERDAAFGISPFTSIVSGGSFFLYALQKATSYRDEFTGEVINPPDGYLMPLGTGTLIATIALFAAGLYRQSQINQLPDEKPNLVTEVTSGLRVQWRVEMTTDNSSFEDPQFSYGRMFPSASTAQTTKVEESVVTEPHLHLVKDDSAITRLADEMAAYQESRRTIAPTQ